MTGEGRDPLIVAIDGPGGVGKSTVARRLAAALSVPYLETGAMYRVLGLKVLLDEIDPGDETAVSQAARHLDLELDILPSGEASIRLEGEPVGDRLRDEAIAVVTSRVAAYPEVRRRMVELQRRFGERTGGVVEGRDIGTKVFPSTPHKFFLEADPEVRARRRLGEHAGRGAAEADLEVLRVELDARDRRDEQRAESPLRKDDSYTVIDTTELSIDEVVAEMLAAVHSAAGQGG